MFMDHTNIQRVSRGVSASRFHANSPPEIIPKFTCLLNRGQPLVLHGLGHNTRRYLFAGDAADAFDTILHKGTIGQVYNVGSYDEHSNLTICSKLLELLKIPHSTQEDLHRWIKHTHDRPFNDHRYAVDGTKLRNLGWDQATSFEKGLAITVDWYKRFGEQWWGDISKVLSPFPIVEGKEVVGSNMVPVEEVEGKLDINAPDEEMIKPEQVATKKRKLDNGMSQAQPLAV
jgi:hypothetical protein